MSRIIQYDLNNVIKALGEDATKLSGKTLLITGGSGFLGSYIVGTVDKLNRNVLEKPCRIISIDNYITGRRDGIFGKPGQDYFCEIEQDVTKPFVVKSEIDFIIHAAGIASPVYYKKYPIETIESAVFGVKNMLELAMDNELESFLFFSSSEVYGDPHPDAIPTPESYKGNVSPIGERACYDESKRLGETLCMIYHKQHGIPVKIVRPFNVYGPGMRPDDYRVIPTFISNVIENKPLPVHGEGNQTRTFCYVSDAVTAFLKVLLSEESGEVYNVGNDENEINMMRLAKMVVGASNSEVEVENVEYPKHYAKDEPKRRCPDLTKIRERLNYEPQVDLKKGLSRSLKWYKDYFA